MPRGKLAAIWDLAAAMNVGSRRASWLFLSERAVETHITNILNKLGSTPGPDRPLDGRPERARADRSRRTAIAISEFANPVLDVGRQYPRVSRTGKYARRTARLRTVGDEYRLGVPREIGARSSGPSAGPFDH